MEVCCTQKGDVYAFSITLYEMIGRNGPWGETQYSSQGKNSKIQNIKPNFDNINLLYRK
jgi:hypothetical protein